MAALDFPNSPTVGQQFTASNSATYNWDGAVWTLAGPTGGGAAGGDLSGFYPNPTIAPGVVTWAKQGQRGLGRVRMTTFPLIVNHATDTPVNFNVVDVNLGGLWIAPDRFTIVEAGTYLVGGSLEYAISAAGSWRHLALLLNGTTTQAASDGAPVGGTRCLAVSLLAPYNANDYIQLRFYQDSGSTMNWTPNMQPNFWIARLG
jgi:hypothetical protein